MTQLGLRIRQHLPLSYNGFHVVRHEGRFYGLPGYLDRDEVLHGYLFDKHAGIVSAATLEELQALIDGYDHRRFQAEFMGSFERYSLFRYGGSFYGVPATAEGLDLNLEEHRRRPGIVHGETREQVEERIRALRGSVPVEFAGWLPIFELLGNCGKHPQFTHATMPPPGYRFTYSAPPRTYSPSLSTRLGLWADKTFASVRSRLWLLVWPIVGIFRGGSGCGLRARLRVLGAMIRLYATLLARGVWPWPAFRFLRTRHYQSQLLLANNRNLVFLTSMPCTYGQNPWVIEIEDPTTLLCPLIHNGQTSDLDLVRFPYVRTARALLESDQCKGILTHIKSTAQLLPALFGSDKIKEKIFYNPLGVKLPERWQRHDESEHIDLLFINSWCQAPNNFYLRGGLDVVEAFALLKERYPQVRLTMRSEVPGLAPHFQRIMEQGWVRLINRFLPPEEMDSLLAESHIFLLPAARIHIVSLLQALSYGLAVVTSDGWGIDDYIQHERNGLIVKGRYGKVSWADEEAGLLREDYEPMFTSDPKVVEGIVEAVSRLVEDRMLRRRLGRAARMDVQTTYSLERWNQGLKEIFDKIHSVPEQKVFHAAVSSPPASPLPAADPHPESAVPAGVGPGRTPTR